ncbi:mucin 2, oligomeric mucus/gel-forming [Ceratobasidium sp. AG-Ba]|nr:mucin 2, oligomeric mucus/gel-forming [Ceratobasidium sp. AG-Ba]
MKLFSRKKSNPQISEPPPNISRPRAQGHLQRPAPGPPPGSRRSMSGNEPPVTTPLYARFARADSIENLSLNLRGPESRGPSGVPSQDELDRGGYERPWARERQASLDAPATSRTVDSAPRPVDPGSRTFDSPSPAQDRARLPLASGAGSTLRMVSGPATTPASADNRKSTASRRLSIDAAIATDPFLASKMQSVMRRAPSNATTNNPPAPPTKSASVSKPSPVPSRSSTAPPPAVLSKPAPTTRTPTAPPTTSSRGPPPTSTIRPSLDLTSDDGHSTFSHSLSGHQTQTQIRPVVKRERGPPPVAGTPSAYAWRSGQSDDGHGGGSNFYTGGSQASNSNQPQLPTLPPGAQPPQPGGQPMKKRAPSNPPVSRVPYPANGPGARRVSVDDASKTSSNGGGPGTWGGVAPGPVVAHSPGQGPPSSYGHGQGPTSAYTPNPTPPYGPTTNPPPSVPLGSGGPIPLGGIRSIPNGAARPVSPTASMHIAGPGFDPYGRQSAPEPQPQRVPEPAVKRAPEPQVQTQKTPSVEPGQIFQHPYVNSRPQPRPTMSLAEMYPPAPPLPSKRMSVSGTPGVAGAAGIGAGGVERGRTSSTVLKVEGRQSPIKETQPKPVQSIQTTDTRSIQPVDVQSTAGRESPVKSIVNGGTNGRESPFKVTRQLDSGRQSPLKVDSERLSAFKPDSGRQSPLKLDAGRQSPFKADGRQTPVKSDTGRRTPVQASSQRSAPSSPQKSISSAQKSTLSVDTAAASSSVRTPSTITPMRTPVSANASIVGAAPSSSVVALSSSSNANTGLSVSTSISGNTNTRSVSPARATPSRSTLSPSPVQSTLSTSPAQPSPARTLPTPSPVRGLPAAPAHGLRSPSPSHGLPPPKPAFSQPPPSSPVRSGPNRALSSTSASSYATAMPAESEYAFDQTAPPVPAPGPSRLALGGSGLAPLNTNTSGLPLTPRDRLGSAKQNTSEMSTPTSTTMMTAPSRSARASSPLTIPSESGVAHDSDNESMHTKKRNLLLKTRKLDGASSFRSSDEKERSESEEVKGARMSAGLEMAEDPFARSPPTIVKTVKKALPLTPDATPDPNATEGNTTPRRGMPLSPPLSSDDHEQQRLSVGLGLGMQKTRETVLMTPALTDNEAEPPSMSEIADMSENEAEMEPESTTPPGSPPPPKVYPLAVHLATPSLLGALLHELSFRDWNALNSLNAGIRRQLEETRALREEVLEFWLRGVGYARWTAPKRETLPLSLRDLNAYMRGVSIAVYRYSAIAESYLAVRAQQEQSSERIPGAASKGNLVRALASSCRAYTKVILRLREQAEAGPNRDGIEFRSPLMRIGHAPLLRVFVPSKEGAWLSDASVLDCEKELKRAGALPLLRVGDVVWDAAVGDEGNAGRMVWDGNYLVDLDYTYSTTGELPKYIHSLAFSPSYWHKIIRTSNSPLCHIDLAPYAAQIAQNLQLVQDRVQTETPQGGRHTVVRWVHRSRFHPRPGTHIPNTNPPSVVDQMWEGVIVVEVEGTNEGLADLQARCGPEVRLFPAKTAGMSMDRVGKGLGKTPFRLLRANSRPGEIWIRAVREKERLV